MDFSLTAVDNEMSQKITDTIPTSVYDLAQVN